jgi:phospholipase C
VPAPGAVTPHPQEPGTRPARALPYALHLSDEVAAGATEGLRLSFDNHGRQGASLWARSRAASLAPRCYTLAAGGHLEDLLPAAENTGVYDWTLHGPNGYVRVYRGSLQSDRLGRYLRIRQAAVKNKTPAHDFAMELTNRGPQPLSLVLKDLAYGQKPLEFTLLPGASYTARWNIEASHHWYDIGISLLQDDAYERRYAGHVETGRASRSDPAAA